MTRARRLRAVAFGIALLLASILVGVACTSSKQNQVVPNSGEATGGSVRLPSASPLPSAIDEQDLLVDV